MKLYISRLRQPDGSWVVDPEPRPLRLTRQLAAINRMDGIVTQVWPEAEARKTLADEFPAEFTDPTRTEDEIATEHR